MAQVTADPDLEHLLHLIGDPDLDEELAKFQRAQREAEEAWQRRQAAVKPLDDGGSTRRLEILPLIDFATSDPSLEGEPGVSYLVETDHKTILFDVGLNQDDMSFDMERQPAHPSRLVRNMERLGVTLDEVDTIVISHNHLDHVGGAAWLGKNTFSLSGEQLNLSDKEIYTPVPMTYPGAEPIHTPEPRIIAPGVATTGTIPAALFFSGVIDEQALAVQVEDRGVVLIVGCGHQTLARLLERSEALIPAPVYGVVGGLHFPVTQSRAYIDGIGLHQRFGTGKPPWEMITMDEVRANIGKLQDRHPQLVGLSAHDSCDASIEAFREAFGDAYHEVQVGDRIVVR